tara:strand:- start:226 stop:768 length:543 start_codon:yes stop_codon:yes gene_type:complete
MSELRTNRIIPRDGLTAGTYFGGGIIQVKQAVKTDSDFSTSSTSYTDITGLSVSITPTRSDSKILVFMDVKIGCTSNVAGFVQMVRGSTAIYIGDSDSNSSTRATAGAADDPSQEFPYQMTGQFLDSPATTSATTYKIQLKAEGPSGNTGTVFVNRSGGTGSGSQDVVTASSILVMEVSG